MSGGISGGILIIYHCQLFTRIVCEYSLFYDLLARRSCRCSARGASGMEAGSWVSDDEGRTV